MGGAILSKFLIQLSVDGWGCVPSLLFDLRPNYGVGNEHNIVKAMVYPVVVYRCESWTKKKAECSRIDAFELKSYVQPKQHIEKQRHHSANKRSI